MRDSRKKGDGRWHDTVEQRAHFAEHKIQRQTSNPTSAMPLLSEPVVNATVE
jgi:hypothetical protein